MRILFLTPGCFDKGGISRYSRYQIEALREICGADNVRALSLLGPDENSLETPFSVLAHGPANRHASIMSRLQFATRALYEALTWRPDVVWSAHVNFTPLLNLAGRLAGARTLLNVYGLEIWSGLTAPRRRAMARVHRVLADCHFTARHVRDEGLHHSLPTVVWDPVDLRTFAPGPADPAVAARYGLPDPDRHTVVMSLGRLARAAAHKGFDRLIATVARLAPAHPDLRLVIAGRGDDRPRLEALAAEHGIADRVIFTGPVDEADLPAIYRAADVFSLVSDRGHGRGEGIPLTPLEAMACGAPIIVGDEDGSQEAVVAGRNGFVVSPRDPGSHAEALGRLARDPSLRARMGGEARKVAEEFFSYGRFVSEHRALLGSL
ncbi:glycosyltransferase family 4 protein [Caulobacter sp. NIBR1757]|uniref:glycosyltransferase family 4 protein n=1 Tax=Caulobacter sp. NIBR1757 TaxID=3016000 RepID=UPI0022EFDC5E|nr:glycosyltransferase family 4 protein [Caulobacter sp. NIBR1757]WGM40037.1 D-inositol-3-phosphate glycosyltransferase [Caulobacter sp. NIBR1757]